MRCDDDDNDDAWNGELVMMTEDWYVVVGDTGAKPATPQDRPSETTAARSLILT